MRSRDGGFRAGVQRAIDADLFLEEFGPVVLELLEEEVVRFVIDPDRPDPEDERLCFRRSDVVGMAVELLGQWLNQGTPQSGT